MYQTPQQLQILHDNIARLFKGHEHIVELAIICLIAEGHMLVEDVPGVGKTTLAKAFARSLDLSMRRVQFTSDLLPSDIIGVSVYNNESAAFEFHPGAIFTNILLADEINRAEPRAQSALLEAMNEKQVSLDSQTYCLPKPFMVFATQNPLDFYGTYPLPESQLDRFLFRVSLGYPTRSVERELILSHTTPNLCELQPVLSLEDLELFVKRRENVQINDSVVDYILNIVWATRETTELELGVSTRTCLDLTKAAKARALYYGRNFVIPEDVQTLVLPACAHRVRMAHNSIFANTSDILNKILSKIKLPE